MTSVSSQSAQANLKTSGLNYTASGLYNTYHNYLLFWSAFIWQIFLERKSSAGCLPKKRLMKICIFRDTQVFSSNYNATWQKIVNLNSVQCCNGRQLPIHKKFFTFVCIHPILGGGGWGPGLLTSPSHVFTNFVEMNGFFWVHTYIPRRQNKMKNMYFVNFFFRFVHKKFVKNMWWALPLTMMGFEEFWDSSIFLR